MALIRELAMVALGSLGGAGLRFLLQLAVSSHMPDPSASSPSSALISFFNLQPFLVPNIIGCLVMGYLVGMLPNWTRCALFDQRILVRLHKGATVGFCGSLTTFSSWINRYMNGNYDSYWFTDLVVLVVDFSITWTALLAGFAVSDLHSMWSSISPSPPQSVDIELGPATGKSSSPATGTDGESSGQAVSYYAPFPATRLWSADFLEMSVCCMTFAAVAVIWVLVIVDCVDDRGQRSLLAGEDRRAGVRALALAPFGAGLRWLLARQPVLLRTCPSLKLHTLTCNWVGLLLAVGVTHYAADWSWGRPFVDGFLGSLTTVSTWFNELRQLYGEKGTTADGPSAAPQLRALRYALTTVGGGLIITQLLRLG